MGDWGEGTPAQKAVAGAMADYVSKDSRSIAAMLSLGDNFYVPSPASTIQPGKRSSSRCTIPNA